MTAKKNCGIIHKANGVRPSLHGTRTGEALYPFK
jgi:hypothetical protein